MLVKWKNDFETELRAKIEKDKKKMGGDLAYYIDAREILGDHKQAMKTNGQSKRN